MSEQHVTVRVTPADQAADPYFYVPVAVPPGTTRLDVTMAYDKTEDCIIDLGVLDPRATDFPAQAGFRGWSGGARDRFFVATDDATPGYIPGPMPAGTWRIILGLYKVPTAGADIVLTVICDSSARPTVDLPPRPRPVRPGAGWYKGDLHCHTFHSDARGAPEVLHAAARQAGLDFLAVTDHNTISQRRYFHPHASPDLVFVRGMEVTTAIGHANAFGIDDWIDFRMTGPSDPLIVAEEVHRRGGLLSINHDKPSIPWDYDLPPIDCMEAWQSTWLFWNWISLARYDARLRTGLHIALIGGSDFHQPDRLMPEGPFVLARPTTVLWLPELSEDAVLAAMKAGHGYVTEAPDGPHLSFTANGQPMGTAFAAGPLEIVATINGAAGDRLVWIDATGEVAAEMIPEASWTSTFRFEAPQTFLRAEIVAEASRERLFEDVMTALGGKPLPDGLTLEEATTQPIRRALSNPVYIGPTG